MFDFTYTLILVGIASILWYLQSCRQESKKFGALPCVSGRLPALGHLPFFGKYPYKTFVEWSKKYGNIYRIQLGPRPAVVVNGQSEIKRISDMIQSAGRPTLMSWEKLQSQFVFDYSSEGVKYRKKAIQAMSVMKDYNFDESVDQCCEDLVTKWLETDGLVVDIHGDIITANSKLMFTYCYGGIQTEQDEKDIFAMCEIVQSFGRLIHAINMIDSFPWLLKIHPTLKKIYKDYLSGIESNATFATRQLQKHIREAEDDDFNAASNLLDALRTVPRRNADGTTLDQRGLMRQIQPIFGAAIDTITVTTTWCVIMFCKYPQYQDDIWDELKSNADVLDKITEKHLSTLVKLEAYINEVLRYVTPLPVAIPRAATHDIHMDNNMIIPKDTFMFFNLWSVNHDDQVWTAPERFHPERFIVDGLLDKRKIENVMSFSHGRRRCIGEVPARKLMPLLVANLLRRCEFSYAEDSQDADLDNVHMALTLRPPAVRVIAKQRTIQ